MLLPEVDLSITSSISLRADIIFFSVFYFILLSITQTLISHSRLLFKSCVYINIFFLQLFFPEKFQTYRKVERIKWRGVYPSPGRVPTVLTHPSLWAHALLPGDPMAFTFLSMRLRPRPSTV